MMDAPWQGEEGRFVELLLGGHVTISASDFDDGRPRE